MHTHIVAHAGIRGRPYVNILFSPLTTHAYLKLLGPLHSHGLSESMEVTCEGQNILFLFQAIWSQEM